MGGPKPLTRNNLYWGEIQGGGGGGGVRTAWTPPPPPLHWICLCIASFPGLPLLEGTYVTIVVYLSRLSVFDLACTCTASRVGSFHGHGKQFCSDGWGYTSLYIPSMSPSPPPPPPTPSPPPPYPTPTPNTFTLIDMTNATVQLSQKSDLHSKAIVPLPLPP